MQSDVEFELPEDFLEKKSEENKSWSKQRANFVPTKRIKTHPWMGGWRDGRPDGRRMDETGVA